MRKSLTTFLFLIILHVSTSIYAAEYTSPLIIDHTHADIGLIPELSLDSACSQLVIAYGHTSHGSQLMTGMEGLTSFKGDKYSYSSILSETTLTLRDRPFSGANDLGNPDRTTWADATRSYLDGHPEVNVIIWSWCGQAGTASKTDIETYLTLMDTLETDYPGVFFVYMTGHLDGSGIDGNLHARNEQIREFCRSENKILYDFADIESYDPDGNGYLDKNANDNCDYDSDGNGSRDANWAEDWQNSHPGEWYDCYSAHSKPLNANLKAYAAWNLWASIAEMMSPVYLEGNKDRPAPVDMLNVAPNPFNPRTTISFTLAAGSHIELTVFNTLGQKIRILDSGHRPSGYHVYQWDTGIDERELQGGVYIVRLKLGGGQLHSKKMLYLK